MADEKPAKKPAADKAPKGDKAPKKEAAPKPKAAKKEAAPASEATAAPEPAPKKVKRPKLRKPPLAPLAERQAAIAKALAKPAAAPQPKSGKTVKITQIGSPIGREDYQL